MLVSTVYSVLKIKPTIRFAISAKKPLSIEVRLWLNLLECFWLVF